MPGTCDLQTRADRLRYRYKHDPEFRLRYILKRGLQRLLDGRSKTGRMEEVVGCSLEKLRAWIERQFLPGMTWENQGTGKGRWQIDHIIPKSKFDLTRYDQLLICWNWSNLRPMWAVANNRKGARITHKNNQPSLPLWLR